jgi:hypothetical protein
MVAAALTPVSRKAAKAQRRIGAKPPVGGVFDADYAYYTFSGMECVIGVGDASYKDLARQ